MNTTYHVSDLSMRYNQLKIMNREYEIQIDDGIIMVNNSPKHISIESNCINLNHKTFMFHHHPFIIQKDIIYCGFGDVYCITEFPIINIRLGRIKLVNDEYNEIRLENGILYIGEVVDYTVRRNRQPLVNNNIIPTTTDNKNVKLDKIARDSQNTHDSYILNKLSKLLQTIIEKTTVTKTINQTIIEMKQFISNKNMFFFDMGDPKKAKQIINHIVKNNAYIVKFDAYELDILNLVWNAVCNDEDLKDIFYSELLSMDESNTTVCVTGRVCRLINIFTGIYNCEIDMQTIHNEMMDKCTIIRHNFKSDDTELLKQEIRKTLYTDYVESNIITIEQFNTEIDSWIDHI